MRHIQNVKMVTDATCIPTSVWFKGTGALKEGTGLCYDFGFDTSSDSPLPVGMSSSYAGALTDSLRSRGTIVDVPIGGSPTTEARKANNLQFAGVAAADYEANAAGQWIDIYEPGSVCKIALGVNDDVTCDSSFATCSAGAGDAGRFGPAGARGRGTAQILQTSTGNVLNAELTGQSALDATGLIVTLGVGSFVTGGVVAGDLVYILGVEDDATGSGTPGVYRVASVTDATHLVLTTAAATGGAVQCSLYVQRGNPLVLAYLMDGNESELIEYIQPEGVGASTAATWIGMQGGVTYLLSGVTPATGDHRYDIADGDYEGQIKTFNCLGAVGTKFIEVNFGTAIQMDGATALADMEFNAAGEIAILIWSQAGWRCLYALGATEN